MFNEMTYFNGVHETVQDILKHYDELGGPTTYPHYAAGLGGRGRHAVHVDQAGCLQLRRHAQRHGRPLAEGHQGEGRGALAVAPCHRHRADGPRSGGPARAEERQRHGADADRRREHGSTPSTTPRRRDRHTTQYFEIFGNRAIYHDGWLAGTVHRAAVGSQSRARPLEDDMWELYDTRIGLQPGERPRREESREAQGAAGPLHEGSGRNTTCCRSTTGPWSASTRRWSGGPT